MAADSKTEKATPKRRRDERKKGNVFMSNDVIVVLGLVGIFCMLRLYFPVLIDTVRDYMVRTFEEAAVQTEFTQDSLKSFSYNFFITGMKAGFPLLIVSAVLPILAVGIQTKFLFTTKHISPKFNRLNPLQGIKKLFSLRSVIELLKSILKTIVLVIILYNILKSDFLQITKTMDMDLAISSGFMLNMVFQMIMKVVLVFTVIAGFDFMYQKWEYEKGIKMTKQEIKEEYKETEGNPEIKGKIKSLQRQAAQKRMMQAVPTADVIVRNPTHFAVALKYDMEKDTAPIVVAKGQDELAFRIIAVGEENGVAIVENRPLARALYAECKLDRQIPAQYYGAVAEILIYVFRANQKWSSNR